MDEWMGGWGHVVKMGGNGGRGEVRLAISEWELGQYEKPLFFSENQNTSLVSSAPYSSRSGIYAKLIPIALQTLLPFFCFDIVSG